MRVLVTGADGFVGRNLVSELQNKFKLICVVLDRKYKNSKAEVVYFTSKDSSEIENAVSKTDVIVHLASIIHGNIKEMHEINVEYTKKIVELAKKYRVKKIIYISSENVSQGNKDYYSATKALAEKKIQKFKNSCILRPTVIYGPGDRKYITKFVEIAKKYPLIPVLGEGNNKFQFIFIKDLIKMIENAIKYDVKGTYVAAGPDILTYNETIEIIMRELHIIKPIVHIPLSLLKPLAYILDFFMKFPPITPGQIENLKKNRCYDIKKTVKTFKCTPTPFKKGLKMLISEEFR